MAKLKDKGAMKNEEILKIACTKAGILESEPTCNRRF